MGVYTCDICWKTFGRDYNLQRHKTLKHVFQSSQPDAPEEDPPSEDDGEDTQDGDSQSPSDDGSDHVGGPLAHDERSSDAEDAEDAVLNEFVEEAIAPYVSKINASDQGQQAAYQALRPSIVKRLMRLYFEHKQREHALDDTLFHEDLEHTASKLQDLFPMDKDESLWNAIKLKRYSFEGLVPKDYPYTETEEPEDREDSTDLSDD